MCVCPRNCLLRPFRHLHALPAPSPRLPLRLCLRAPLPPLPPSSPDCIIREDCSGEGIELPSIYFLLELRRFALGGYRLDFAEALSVLSEVESGKMFLKTQLSWNVLIPAENLDAKGLMLQKAILVRLLDEFANRKTSKDIGYFLAVKTLDRIGEGIVREHSGDLLFPVDFSCITFKMMPGEVLEGVVHKILKHGVFLRCGPAEKIYLSQRQMADYQYVPGETPFFRNDKSSKIEKGSLVRFVVLGERYAEAERDFRAIVSLTGEFLGPIS